MLEEPVIEGAERRSAKTWVRELRLVRPRNSFAECRPCDLELVS